MLDVQEQAYFKSLTTIFCFTKYQNSLFSIDILFGFIRTIKFIMTFMTPQTAVSTQPMFKIVLLKN